MPAVYRHSHCEIFTYGLVEFELIKEFPESVIIRSLDPRNTYLNERFPTMLRAPATITITHGRWMNEDFFIAKEVQNRRFLESLYDD